ncbi:hypothetical protein SALCHL_003891 [Streptomyces albus subsp. chlorinus]
MARGMENVEKKVRSGERLSREDGLTLYASDDLARLGGLAHEVRTLKNGEAAHFAVRRRVEIPDASALDEAVGRATRGAAAGATELHLRFGAGLPWEECVRALRTLRAALPEAVALHAFTAAGVRRLAALAGTDESEILDELAAAGPASLLAEDAEESGDGDGPGAGWEDWARVHRLAHRKGLTTSCTLPYGHTEDVADRVDHLLRLRQLQDETGGFRILLPLRRPGARGATGAEVLATFAVARLLLDNVPHLAVDWALHGAQTAQLALQHGADEMAGQVVEDGQEPDGERDEAALTREDLVDLIRDAGLRPVERDARYGALRTYEGPDPERRESPQPMRV